MESKFIVDYCVTDASVHDSKCCLELITDEDQVLYADSAYFGQPISDGLPPSCEKKICERGKRNAPLTDAQREANRLISKIRARIEHIFGFMVNSMCGKALRCIGIIRVRFMTGLTNLVYNMCRYRYLKGVFWGVLGDSMPWNANKWKIYRNNQLPSVFLLKIKQCR